MAEVAAQSREDLIETTGRELAGALAEMAEMAVMAEQQSRSVRRRIASEVRALMASSSGMTEAELTDAVVAVANGYAPELDVSTSPSDALVPLGEPVFETLDHCGDRAGWGVRARFGSVTVSLAVAGSLADGLTGGGFDFSVEY